MSCDNFKNHKCSTCDNRKVIVVQQKRKYTLNNTSEKYVCTVKVDGCLITEGARCDYLIINCDESVAYYVELKGKDFLYAIEQITRSIELLSDKINGCKINARIVLTRVPAPDLKNYPKILRFEKLLRGYNGNLRKDTIHLVEQLP